MVQDGPHKGSLRQPPTASALVGPPPPCPCVPPAQGVGCHLPHTLHGFGTGRLLYVLGRYALRSSRHSRLVPRAASEFVWALSVLGDTHSHPPPSGSPVRHPAPAQEGPGCDLRSIGLSKKPISLASVERLNTFLYLDIGEREKVQQALFLCVNLIILPMG